MRIHYLSSSTLISDSANAVHVMKMSEAITALGHDVTLHSLKGEGQANDDVLRYYDVKDQSGFKLERHNEGRIRITRLLRSLQKAIPFLKIGGLPSLLYAYIALRPKIGDQADLIFSRNMYWLYALRNKAPFIYESTAHLSPPYIATLNGGYLLRRIARQS